MKRLLLIFALTLPCYGQILAPILQQAPPSGAIETIAFDTAVDGGFTASGTSYSWNHTVTGIHPILYVGVFGSDTSDLITGCTYNGVAMTLVAKEGAQAGITRWAYLYVLAGAATGTNAVLCSASSATAIGGASASYTHANTSGQPDSSNHSISGASATYSISTTTVKNNSWTILFVKTTSGTTYTGGSGTTVRVQNSGWGISDSNGPITPAGSTSLNMSSTGTPQWSGIISSFSPFGS